MINYMLRLVTLTLAFVLIASQFPCEPFGLRIYYGDVVINSSSLEKFVVYFNTKQGCPDSYVNFLINGVSKNSSCTTKTIVTSSFMNNYTTFIHVCPTNDVNFQQTFQYTAFGWNSSTSTNPTSYKEQLISVKLIDPTVSSRSVKLIVLADWGTMESNSTTPTTSYIKNVSAANEINAVLVAGDIGYDLDTQYGRIYEDFLNLMQEFSPRLPFFLAPGNHERRNVDAAYLFNETFKVYGVDITLATGIYFGSVFLIVFDTYKIYYNQTEPISSLNALKTQLAIGLQSGRFIIPYSHYPLTCSAQYSQCDTGLNRTQTYFDAMIDYGVSLYIGAHTHVYQRIFPYYKNRVFGNQTPPYTSSGKYIISILEGVAGSNRTVQSSISSVQSFTANFTVNETGFGVIEATTDSVSYNHFSTKQGFIDKFIINISKSTSKQNQNTLIIILVVIFSVVFVVICVIVVFKLKKTATNKGVANESIQIKNDQIVVSQKQVDSSKIDFK